MKLDETLAFVAVARAGSFTAASRKLDVPKSTLSRQVTRLEERLDARLLQRTTRKLSLTDTGRAYLERCARAIDDIGDADRAARDVADRAAGVIKVTAPFDFARDNLAHWLKELRTRHKQLDVHLLLTQQRMDLVAEGIDVAIRAGVLPDAGTVARRLAGSPIHLYASPRYLARRGRPKTFAALAKHELLAFTAPWVFSDDQGNTTPLPDHAWLRVNEWGVLHVAARDGLGVAVLPDFMTTHDVREHRLERVLPQWRPSVEGALYAVYPSRNHLSPKVRVFVDFLVEKCAHAYAVT